MNKNIVGISLILITIGLIGVVMGLIAFWNSLLTLLDLGPLKYLLFYLLLLLPISVFCTGVALFRIGRKKSFSIEDE